MTHLYYECPLKAAWMQVRHGMQFECPKISGDVIHAAVDRETHAFNVGHLAVRPFFKAYIHHDSLHLLEPKDGDDIEIKDNEYYGGRHITSIGHAHSSALGLPFDHAYRGRNFRIIQRNGVAFMWPESEAA